MPDDWYYADGKGRAGPLTLQQLRETLATFSTAKAGALLVWRAGFPNWKPAREFVELGGEAPQPPPLPSDNDIGQLHSSAQNVNNFPPSHQVVQRRKNWLFAWFIGLPIAAIFLIAVLLPRPEKSKDSPTTPSYEGGYGKEASPKSPSSAHVKTAPEKDLSTTKGPWDEMLVQDEATSGACRGVVEMKEKIDNCLRQIDLSTAAAIGAQAAFKNPSFNPCYRIVADRYIEALDYKIRINTERKIWVASLWNSSVLTIEADLANERRQEVHEKYMEILKDVIALREVCERAG